MEKPYIEICWTGGYDSTFRICQLSRREVVIQPFYLSDNRASESYELHAIEIIRDKLLRNPKTIAKINPIIYVKIQDRKRNDLVTKAFNSLLEKDFMGSQYEWLGWFSLEHQGIELSIHNDDKAIELIRKHGVLTKVNEEYGSYYVIDRDNSEQDLVALFGNERFPLADYTKLQMKEEYRQMRLSDIINDTWFCFTPIDGKPCGLCNPCRYTIEEGMSERFTQEALDRYKKSNTLIYKTVKKSRKIIKKIIRLCRGVS